MSHNKTLQIPLDMATSGEAWCCISPQHNLLAKYTIAATEAESKAIFLEGAPVAWNYYEREHGWACVKVTITPFKST